MSVFDSVSELVGYTGPAGDDPSDALGLAKTEMAVVFEFFASLGAR